MKKGQLLHINKILKNKEKKTIGETFTEHIEQN